MANPPDRLDGFHCYNTVCGCRSSKDKGRSVENMKSYTRDRRAYEYYSDGDILLTNSLMGKLKTTKKVVCFCCNKKSEMTGDHIGPISYGFIHDPINLQACCSSCNSTKNNRLTQDDINKLLLLEKDGKVVISWWAKDCWNKNKSESIKTIRDEMNKNSKKFLKIQDWLKENKTDICSNYIKKYYNFDNKSYTIKKIVIDSINGNISYIYGKKVSTKKTKNKQKERTIEKMLEKSKKLNRKIKIKLKDDEITILSGITCDTFKSTICKVLQM